MDKRKPQPGGERQLESLVEELFKHAAPRPQPPPAVAESVREAVHREWDRVVAGRVSRRRLGWMAAAASVLIMAGAATLALRPNLLFGPSAAVASIERIGGEVRAGADGTRLEVGDELRPGQVLTTLGDAMVALRPATGGSLRMAPGSTIELAAADHIELVAGAVYFDSRAGADRGPGHIQIATELGTVRDVGTQFVTRFVPGTLAVSVREGLVTVERGGEELIASVGERLTLGPASEPVRREAIATFGAEWQWTEQIAPAFALEGRRLIDVLGWFARETGRELEFGSLDARRVAGEAIIYESAAVELQRPALTKWLATADLEHRLVGAKIYITLRAR